MTTDVTTGVDTPTAPEPSACMSTPTVSASLKRSALLAEKSETPRLEVELLLSAALKQTRTWLYTWPERQLTQTEADKFETLLQRRLAGEPIAYILGQREFWSLTLKVNTSTLIPRSDTETLVERVLQTQPASRPLSIVDLGTGTGAIALALASERPHWQLIAVDQSTEAVALASENTRRLRLQNVSVLQSNWLSQVEQPTQVDVIVSNPPYIDPEDPHLHQGDLRFEPRSALVADNQGLADIQIICQQAATRLAPDGWLFLEHGFQQAASVRDYLQKLGYQEISTTKDIAGLERVTEAKAPGHGV